MATGVTGPLKPIQVIPPGLTGILQLKQEGRLPDKLSDIVSPVIEMRDWYFTARRLTELSLFGGIPTIALATGVLGSNFFKIGGVNQVVPANQIWYVEQLTVAIAMTGAAAATDLLRLAPMVATTQGIGQVVGPDVSDYQLAARLRQLEVRADRPFWAFPGDIFAVDVFDVVTTNGWTLNLGIRATPMTLS